MRKQIICLLMFVVMIVVAGCGGGKSETSEKTPKDTLVVGLPVDLASIDPAVAMDNKAWKVSYPCYERLVQYKKTTNGKASTEVGPSLAKSWTVSNDGLTWTFNLEKGHKFADGTPVDSKAVKFSVERVMAVKKGPADYFKPVKSIETPNADTVIFKLAQPFAPFLDTLAVNAAGIVNPKVMEHEKDGDKGSNYLAAHTMGSGMYELTEFNPGQDIKMVMNKNHFGKEPAIKTILFKVIKDPSAERLQLESGDLDIAAGIPMDQLDQLKSNKAIQIFESPSLLTSIVYINNQKAPLNNVKLRQAISYAVDYKGIVYGAVKGRGQQLTTPVPQGMWGRDDSIKGYSLEPDKAKALLKEAGLENGVTLKLLYSDNQGFNETQALMLQNSLGKVGIKLELEKVAWATFRERVDKGDFDLAMGTWSPDYADPQFFMTYWFDSKYFGLAGNRAFYKNDAVDTILREAEKITDQNKRIELYKKAQAMVLADAPYIFLFQTNVLTPMRANIKGYVYNPMLDDMYNFEDMSK